jgi:hypothetical protein
MSKFILMLQIILKQSWQCFQYIMEICDMIWVEFDKNKNFKDIHSTIAINVYKHYKNSYWCEDFLHNIFWGKFFVHIFTL